MKRGEGRSEEPSIHVGPRTEGLTPDPSLKADRFEDDGFDDGEGVHLGHHRGWQGAPEGADGAVAARVKASVAERAVGAESGEQVPEHPGCTRPAGSAAASRRR